MLTPNTNETRNDFIERCMRDDESVADFNDESLRFTFCSSVYDDHARSDAEVKVMIDEKKELIDNKKIIHK